MPTGPFRNMGIHMVREHDGKVITLGASSRVTIIKATNKYIKYTRKDTRFPNKIHHAKIFYRGNGKWMASMGNFCYIEISKKK